MALNRKIMTLLIAGTLIFAFVMFVVSNIVPSWSRSGNDDLEIRYGLWENCTVSYTDGTKECSQFKCPDNENDPNNICAKILAARALIISSCIISGISIIVLCISAATNERKRFVLLFIGKVLTFLCLITSVIGTVIGIIVTLDIDPEVELKWGGSSVVAIIGIVINYVAAVASIIVQ